MMNNNLRLAWESIKKAKWRNFMTMLGIIIGTASVITIVSIGEGVRKEVTSQVEDLGTNLIIVRPSGVQKSSDDAVNEVDVFSSQPLTPLSDEDVKAVGKTPGVSAYAPLMVVSGVPKYEGTSFEQGMVVGTSSDFADLVRNDVEFGQFISDSDEGRLFAVIGKNVAEQLFGQNVPIGRSVEFGGEKIIVKGVFSEFQNDLFTNGVDLDNAIFVPYTTAKVLNDGNAAVFQIYAEPAADKAREEVAANIDKSLLKTHQNQRDFMVVTQEEALAASDNILVLLTGFVAGIAGISLLVGGIGIMNVMLVSVTERTKEIGIRKAVGATSRQILSQFLVEAVVLSSVGSVLGVFVAGLANLVLRIVTDLQPVIVWQVVLVAVAVSLVTGVLFGVAPAIKAAKKDPIEALRYE